MLTTRLCLRAIALAVLTVAALPNPLLAADTSFQNPLKAGATITIRAIDGRIDVRSGTGVATVVATATVKDGRPVDMHAVQERSSGSWTVCAVPIAQTACSGGADVHNLSTRIDFHVTLPAGVALNARDASGDISVRNVASAVDAEDVSGSVSITTSGKADAKAVSGNVTIAADQVTSANTISGSLDIEVSHVRSELSADTISGSVRIAIPRGSNATIRAQTISGEIAGSGGVNFSGASEFVGHRETATIGHGGASVNVKTISGTITVAGV